MNKLFETNTKLATITNPDTVIIWREAPYIEYEQIRLDDNLKQYLEAIQSTIVTILILQTHMLEVLLLKMLLRFIFYLMK